ncbi:MAG: hypothetical protein KDB27_16270 [Planctomycetales bacterium]|nr:hypothetical protein [Planctomycetales bacterium]
MLNIDENIIYGGTFMIHLCGIVTVFASRYCRDDCRAIWNGLFFMALLLVGLITLVSIWHESGHWLVSSSTLAVMVVGATLESGNTSRVSAI